MNQQDLKEFLNEKADQYNSPSFIDSDPVLIPHQFQKKEDIEISGFLAATIAWGQRPTIIKNAQRLVEWMDHAPHDFILHHQPEDRIKFKSFAHRTFNYDDLLYFLASLQNIYTRHGGLENVFLPLAGENNMKHAIARFRGIFFELDHLHRTRKHVSDPFSNSACKRLNMYLRWMIRSDNRKVDFGIWKHTPAALLSCPLDVHTGNVARKLGLLSRKQNDWKAVEELDANLRKFDPVDPVKYDFALFGLGIFEGLK